MRLCLIFTFVPQSGTRFMKKVLISLALLTVLAAPLAALAQGPQECCTLSRAIRIEGPNPLGTGTVFFVYPANAVVGPTSGVLCNNVTVTVGTPNWGMLCLINTFNGIVNWVFTILIILVVFFTILGAFTIVTASGKAEQVTTGKNYILYAAIGLAVAFLARAIPGVVTAIVGL
jgi:hypothetical protein